MLAQGFPQWAGWAYAGVAGVAAVTDYRTGKIFNWLTFPALLVGVSLAAYFGVSSLASALEGVLVAFLIFIPLFATGVLGGGDVKLALALATVLGARGVFEMICMSILIAGVGSVALLFRHNRVKIFILELAKFFRSIVTPGLTLQWPILNREIKAPFGLAMFWAFLYVFLGAR